VIEDKFPEKFKRTAYHPSIFVLAWKKSDLEKLFEELMASNTAIKKETGPCRLIIRSIKRLKIRLKLILKCMRYSPCSYECLQFPPTPEAIISSP